MPVSVFGVRHHGPGSARSLRRALCRMTPDAILIEGPPDAADVLPLAAHPAMRPPVSLLVYMPDEPRQAVHYPFAVFSPEWQAIHYGLERSVPVRFIDLPVASMLPIERAEAEEGEPAAQEGTLVDRSHTDPFQAIAEAAGLSDGEAWWEQMVEHRQDETDLFQAILDLMAAVREETPEATDKLDTVREAHMRQAIRTAVREGHERIAVVCGAWHAPELATLPSAARDAELLRGLPKAKVTATWVPWTYGHLTRWSGYGAGIHSPAWYEHLWHAERSAAPAWLARAARLMREEDLPASPASVVEAVRLADALSALRDRPDAGLVELCEAVQSVFCFGSAAPMRLISESLIVGERLGSVPDETPMLPIQQDLRREQRRLRLEPEATQTEKDLDLRNPTDLDRSRLLHRLSLLDVPWGVPRADRALTTGARSGRRSASGPKGTFHEVWVLQWDPALEPRLIEANVWGSAVAAAAGSRVVEQSGTVSDLGELTALVERTLLADLADALPRLIARLQSMAAVTSDAQHLMGALPPLANVLRYGDVRQTDTSMVADVVDGLVARICVGLPAACASLSDEAADQMYSHLMATNDAVALLQVGEYEQMWRDALARLADQNGLHGLIAGRCARLLLDRGAAGQADAGRRMGLALSPGSDPAYAAAWVEGFLRQSGIVLLHDEALWATVDRWLAELAPDRFEVLLPVLRRTFATFAAPERRNIGERARAGAGPGRAAAVDDDVDAERADRVLPLLARLLGVDVEPGGEGR